MAVGVGPKAVSNAAASWSMKASTVIVARASISTTVGFSLANPVAAWMIAYRYMHHVDEAKAAVLK